MAIRRWAKWTACTAVVVTLCLVFSAFLAVQIQQWMLRWRAERLLSDMQQIRLYQSTWPDAQRLMHRWGAWGHYDGDCTAASCEYKIEMGSIYFYNPRVPRHAWLDWLLVHDRLNLYQWFGGRYSVFFASFKVHDGTIWRESTSIGVSVPTRKIRKENDFDWTLSVGAESRQRLNSVFGYGEDQLAYHPYYKVGRPGGCESLCRIVSVYYSTHTPPAEIERITSYDFSCFTRFHPCTEIEDLLPAAKEWNLYSKYESSPTVPIPPPMPPSAYPISRATPCDVPVWVLARDAQYVLSVESLSKKKEEDWEQEVAKVRIITSLKEPPPWPLGAVMNAHLPIRSADSSSDDPAHLVPGKRFILFLVGNGRRDQIVTKDSYIPLERCDVQEDTPEVRRELEKGFAQNDALPR